MDILFVRNLFRPADFGGNRYPWEVTRRLAARHSVRVVTPRPGGPLPGPTPVELHHYPVSRRTPFETFFTNAVFARAEIERQIARRRPDVIVFSSYDAAYGYLGLLPHRTIPTVYIYHSSFYSPAVDRVAKRPIPLRWGHRPLARFLTHVEHVVYDRSKAIVAVSPFSRREIEARLGRPDDRIVVIPTGVDLDLFAPGDPAAARRRIDVPSGARLLVTAGRLAPVKRYDRAVDAVQLLARDDPHWQLLIVGSGPERRRLEDHVRSRGAGALVRFAGHLDGDDLVACYRAADVVLCTSDFENWSLALLEAMACGALVVGTPRGSIPDMLGAVDPRLLADGVEPASIAAAVRALMALPDAERAALRARAHDVVATGYSWDKTVARLEDALRAVIG